MTDYRRSSRPTLTQAQIDEWVYKESRLDTENLHIKPANRYLLVLLDLETNEFVPHFFVSLLVMRKGFEYFEAHHDIETVYDTHTGQHLDPDELPEA